MSVKVMSEVWALQLNHPDLIVLLALADFADDEGRNIYPSMGRIGWKAGYSKRTVQRIIDGLEKQGLITLEGKKACGRGNTNCYRINVEKGVRKSPFAPKEKVSPRATKGVTTDAKGVTAMTPNPLVEPSKNRQSTPISPNGHELSYEEAVLQDRQQSVCRWYRRRENTKWTEKELKAFKAVVPDTDEEDFAALDRYYSARLPKERDFRRRQMITLFNNWPGEVDRARRWVEENGESMDLDEDGNKWAKVIE